MASTPGTFSPGLLVREKYTPVFFKLLCLGVSFPSRLALPPKSPRRGGRDAD